MGRRHSKNAGVMGSEQLTYHERRALGFGTVKERLGKEAQCNYYDCRLTMQASSTGRCLRPREQRCAWPSMWPCTPGTPIHALSCPRPPPFLAAQPAIEPMVTPDGTLYSKEAIFENLLAQKKAIKKQMAAWEAEQAEQAQQVHRYYSRHMRARTRGRAKIRDKMRESEDATPGLGPNGRPRRLQTRAG